MDCRIMKGKGKEDRKEVKKKGERKAGLFFVEERTQLERKGKKEKENSAKERVNQAFVSFVFLFFVLSRAGADERKGFPFLTTFKKFVCVFESK